ncbi:MAG: alpha/beta hydrolase [Sphaerotilus natans subsp. sulfidivorans]|uniref:alpha/beta hydrolase n=1 Tax=Sphaerotilus sulfidivorans TaxID=639200 RepID=UPI002355DD43|nr:alpha/beta hydrolase [Sphaerotilus sulfidivorans]MCK6403491.1 alpha/beta hydrolase [Sphaerotilus sulfidivorans]
MSPSSFPAPGAVPEAIAARLRELGPGFNLPEVQALYAPLLQAQPREGVVRHEDLAYGGHGRHRLDVFAPAGAGAGAAAPVLVWFHGGGFIRGSRQARANVGWWGARQGFVTVLPDYRLAPESRWPSGPQDVAAVWGWLQVHIESLGGDPRRIVLAGESAGAAHVAAATLWRRFQPPGWQPAGAALLSGPYNARLEGLARTQFGVETPDPRNEAYFGQDPADWDAASLVDHIDAAPLPLWISFAERDLLQMQVQAGELFARLVSRHGFAPELRLLREHNHFSAGHSFNTADETVSAPLADFVRRCTAAAGS